MEKVVRTKDYLRGTYEEIILRFDEENLIELACHCNYDQALPKKDGNRVMLLKKVEIQNKDDSWSLYPSVTWLDGVESEEQLETKALVKRTGEEGIDVMCSPDGLPDGKLMLAAEEVGVYTETIDG
ncbi:MAG: hypothetical protein GF370_00055 [Candidatus Nealsonbacteria bacterium]|nr:hypothetical protein [Candidatus Nealsonbacteria bacterium]